MKKYWVKKAFKILLLAIVGVTVLSFIVMSLWNNILVGVLHVGAITFWQALGIFILSKILFGGFKGGGFRGGMHGHGQWKNDMREKWQGVREKWDSMAPEEREKFKQEWKNQCRGRGMWGQRFGQGPFDAKTDEGSSAAKSE